MGGTRFLYPGYVSAYTMQAPGCKARRLACGRTSSSQTVDLAVEVAVFSSLINHTDSTASVFLAPSGTHIAGFPATILTSPTACLPHGVAGREALRASKSIPPAIRSLIRASTISNLCWLSRLQLESLVVGCESPTLLPHLQGEAFIWEGLFRHSTDTALIHKGRFNVNLPRS